MWELYCKQAARVIINHRIIWEIYIAQGYSQLLSQCQYPHPRYACMKINFDDASGLMKIKVYIKRPIWLFGNTGEKPAHQKPAHSKDCFWPLSLLIKELDMILMSFTNCIYIYYSLMIFVCFAVTVLKM